MMNNYRSPETEIVGREGQMYNEATITDHNIEFNDFGIFANDNTYAVSFNPYYNRPKTKYIEQKPVRRPPWNQHRTKTYNEPPVSMTDGMFFMKNDSVKPPPLLPVHLKKPQDLARIQGLAKEHNKGNIIYGPTHTNTVSYNIY